jgi:hypothetical protein
LSNSRIAEMGMTTKIGEPQNQLWLCRWYGTMKLPHIMECPWAFSPQHMSLLVKNKQACFTHLMITILYPSCMQLELKVPSHTSAVRISPKYNAEIRVI